MERPSFYITTPIYYVNSVPHLGTAYTTIAADALARYRRMTGYDVHFLTGLDEHGQKVAQAAEINGMTPQAWVDTIAPKFLDAWRLLDISNDDFIRTTEPRHERGAQRFLQVLKDNGDLYQGHYEGWYCLPDETFYTEEQLGEGRACPQCGRECQLIHEDNWFFRLSVYQDRLLEHYAAHPDFIQPETRRNEVVSFVTGGLKDLSVSRTAFTWGIPLPFDPEHVMYVWFDALINYITAVGYGADGTPSFSGPLAHYWPAQYHFVGKDIIRFHCTIWPAMLMAAGLPLPEKVFAHGFLLTKGEKMSKSKGNAVSPLDLVERFGADAYRYYFLREVQFGTDGSISVEAMVQRYNADLANDWGNLVSRVLNMTETYCGGAVPAAPVTTDADEDLVRIAARLPEAFERRMLALDYAGALEDAWELVKRANRYVEDAAPWNLAKSEETRSRLEAVLYNALEAMRIVALLIAPVMPNTSREVWRRLGLGDVREVTDLAAAARWGGLPAGSHVEKGEALFPRIYEDPE
jgi:methionyl-tRNA synthetase